MYITDIVHYTSLNAPSKQLYTSSLIPYMY